MTKTISRIFYQCVFPITVLVVCHSPAFAQHEGAGMDVFDFLNVKHDARTAGLGGASAAIPGELYGTFTNPATVGFITTMQGCAGNRTDPAGMWGYILSFARPIKDMGVFAVQVPYLTSGKIKVVERGNDGAMVSTGQYAGSDEIAGGLTFARQFNHLSSAGITVKGLYNRLGIRGGETWSASGIALDAGLQFRLLNTRLIYGFAARNFGYLISSYVEGTSYDLPATLTTGISYVPENTRQLRLALDLSKRNNEYLTIVPALEWELVRNQMVVRAGLPRSWRDYKSYFAILGGEPETDYQSSNRSFLCAGAGFITKIVERTVKIDAALDFPSDEFNLMPAFTVSVLSEL